MDLNFTFLLTAIVLLFLTKYAGLNPVWLTAFVVAPTFIFLIYSNIKSLINKEFRTFAGIYPVQKLRGVDAQLAAIIMLIFSVGVLVFAIFYLYSSQMFYKALNLLFGQNRLFYTGGAILILGLIYVYLIIFKNKNR